jgi:hypothetical protein
VRVLWLVSLTQRLSRCLWTMVRASRRVMLENLVEQPMEGLQRLSIPSAQTTFRFLLKSATTFNMGCQRNTTTKSKKQVVRSEHMVVFGCDSHTCPFVFRLKAIVSGLELFRLFLCARQVAPRFATGCFATLASQHLLRTLASPQLLRHSCFATLASRHLLRDSATLASRHLLRDTCS